MNTDSVSLAVPGRSCASTVRQFIEVVVPLIERDGHAAVRLVDDSADEATS